MKSMTQGQGTFCSRFVPHLSFVCPWVIPELFALSAADPIYVYSSHSIHLILNQSRKENE